MHKAQHFAPACEFGKLVRMIIAHHWQVLRRGTQVLPDRQQVTLRRAQIPHGRNDFLRLFTEADPAVVLHQEPEKIWEQVIKSMGIDPGWVVPAGGVN